MTFQIAGREIGPDSPPLVIAEIGINHEGSYEKAVQMVDAAAAAGADVVKFQCHITDKEMVPTDMKPGEISDERLWDIIERCELTEDEERQLMAHCADCGVTYLSTPFSREASDRLEAMGVQGFKIGSGECNNYPLLDHVARKGKPMIVSTGMNELESISRAVETVRKHDVPLALLHCTSMYPTPYDKVRLGAVTHLQQMFPDVPVGLSDHSLDVWTCIGAVALGACILEKHFTVSRAWPGPDTGISIEPDELERMVKGANAVWQARGGSKTILDDEKPVIDFAYASVVSVAPIGKGEALTRDNIWVKRPGTGAFLAGDYDDLLGRVAAVDIPAERAIAPEDLV